MSSLSESGTSQTVSPAQQSFYDRHTPGPGYTCKAECCTGEVKKRVAGISSSGYFFKLPTCTLCQRVYLHAIDAPVTGIKEFEKAMNQAYCL